jgi:hypothetical protein
MHIVSNLSSASSRRSYVLPRQGEAPDATLSNTDVFVRSAKVVAGTTFGAAIGCGLGDALTAGGFGNGVLGALTGFTAGSFIASRYDKGEGVAYTAAGAAIGAVAGAVLGTIGGEHVRWVGAAAVGLAGLQFLR